MKEFNIELKGKWNADGIFKFEPINEQVKIVPMSTLFCKRVMDRFRKAMTGIIRENCCFTNAVIAAKWFQEQGFDVDVAEGSFHFNDYAWTICKKYGLQMYSQTHEYMNNGPQDHRFCRKGDKYFDPTLEFIFGFEWTKGYDYTASRVYDADELISFAITIGATYGEKPHFCGSISGLTYAWKDDEDIPIHWGKIDDNGVYVPPMENPYELLRKAVA